MEPTEVRAYDHKMTNLLTVLIPRDKAKSLHNHKEYEPAIKVHTVHLSTHLYT